MSSVELAQKTSPLPLLDARGNQPALEAIPELIPELRPRFRLSTLFLGVTSCAVCLGVARSMPELAIAMVFVMAVAMIRVLYGIQLFANAGAKLSFFREIGLYLASILVVVAIGGFVVCAFGAMLGACLGLGILIAHNADARQTEWIFGGFISGWILGLVAAAITGGWVTKMLWFSKLGPTRLPANAA